MTANPKTPQQSNTGLDSNLAGALAYLGGPLSGALMLVVEKRDQFVRFHAMQSLIVFLIALVVDLVLLGVPGVGGFLHRLLIGALIALWVFLMYQALQDRRFKLPYLGDLVEQQLAKMTPRP